MEKRVELAMLTDFYGPLLTEHKREVLLMYGNEDMTLQEIADQLGISRQGAYDAVRSAQAQLEKYEEVLGLMKRYMGIRKEVSVCREYLSRVEVMPGSEAALEQAREALTRIDRIER